MAQLWLCHIFNIVLIGFHDAVDYKFRGRGGGNNNFVNYIDPCPLSVPWDILSRHIIHSKFISVPGCNTTKCGKV